MYQQHHDKVSDTHLTQPLVSNLVLEARAELQDGRLRALSEMSHGSFRLLCKCGSFKGHLGRTDGSVNKALAMLTRGSEFKSPAPCGI